MLSLHVARQRVAREDVLTFVNAARASTAQEVFEEDAMAQSVSLDFLHEYMLVNYRALYARTLALGLNAYNQGLVVGSLLASGAPEDEQERAYEASLIAYALDKMPAPQAYKALVRLRAWGVNNARSRQVVRWFLSSRPDLPFHVLKYRGHIKALARHAHLRFGPQTSRLLFEAVGRGCARFEHPLYEQFRQAHYSDDALYGLPFTVAEGLAASRGVKREVLLARLHERGMLTKRERERLNDSAQAAGVDLEVDLGRMSVTRQAAYILSLSAAERVERGEALEASLLRAGAAAWRRQGLDWRDEPVALVVDRSYSSRGGRATSRHSLAVGLGLWAMLSASGGPFETFWSSPLKAAQRPYQVYPFGQTSLVRPLLEALRWGAKRVIIVSDGYENDPPGGVDAVLRAYLGSKAWRAGGVELLHLNPVFSARSLEVKGLSPQLVTLGVREAEELGMLVSFSSYASGQAQLVQLTQALDARRAQVQAMGDVVSSCGRAGVLGP